MKSDKGKDRLVSVTEHVMPVIEEQASLGKQTVETGRVTVSKRTVQHQAVLDDVLVQEHVRVERVPVDRFVEERTPVRYEGETIVVPVFEEVPVVVTRLRLKEEVRITRERTTEPYREQVEVRREEVSVERKPSPPGSHPEKGRGR